MNLQELGTIAHYQYPVKIFYLSNNGYSSIRQTQDSFFGRRTGPRSLYLCRASSHFRRIAGAYGIEHVRTDSISTINHAIAYALAAKRPALCEVLLSQDYVFAPKVSSERLPDGRTISKPIEDLYPFLPHDELMSNMIVDEIARQ